MISFLDGPAEGQKLACQRAPIFLRAVQARDGSWDALDQPEDEPDRANEKVFVYVRQEKEPTAVHLTRRPASKSGWFQMATYRLANPQPSSPERFITDSWQKWCRKQPPVQFTA